MAQQHSKFQVPWGAIYKAAERDGQVRPSEPGTLLFGRSTNPWKLLSVSVSQTRYWACSSAQFVIARPILSQPDKYLKLDTTSGLEDQSQAGPYYFDLRPEDPIIIDLGYAAAPFSDNPIDELSKRVFFGYVDTIKVTANSRGVKVTVSCRDPMRFLIDNKFSGSIISSNFRLFPNIGFDRSDTGVSGIKNPNIIKLDPKEVERALAGPDDTPEQNIYNSQNNPGLFLQPGPNANGQDGIDLGKGSFDKHKIMAWLIFAGSNGACLPAPLFENDLTFNDPTHKKEGGPITGRDPKLDVAAFERSTRPITSPPDALNAVSGFNVMNRFPLEVLKHLGSLEAEPRELYADIDTARICWRRKRTYNTDQPRIYTFLTPVRSPDGKEIKGVTDADGYVQPNVIAAETDWSTVGTVSEVVVINPISTSNAGATDSVNRSSGVISVTGRLPDNRFYPSAIPVAFPGLKRFTRRTRYVFDDTITAEDTENANGLIEAFLRIWGKDIRAGTFTIPGDPLLRAGHAVQLHNFGIFDPSLDLNSDMPFFRAEAVVHKMTAAGPNRGYRTQVSFGEADETRAQTMQDLYATLGSTGGVTNAPFAPTDTGTIAQGKSVVYRQEQKGLHAQSNVAPFTNDQLDGGGGHP